METSNIALFIDYENINGTKSDRIDTVLNTIKEKDLGRVLIKRAYADWEIAGLNARRAMLNLAVDPIELPVYDSGGLKKDKNAADIRLVVDALEVALVTNYIDTIIIVANDRDYIPLIAKLRALNKTVIFFTSEFSTSPLLKGFCDAIYYYTIDKKSTIKDAQTKSDILPAYTLLISAVKSMSDKGYKCTGGSIKPTMKRMDPTFDEEQYGYDQFTKFLLDAEKAKIIEYKMDDGIHEKVATLAADSEKDLERLHSRIATDEISAIKKNSKLQNALGKAISIIKEYNRYGIPINYLKLSIEIDKYYKLNYKDLGVKQFKNFVQTAIDANIVTVKKDSVHFELLHYNSDQKLVSAPDFTLPLECFIDYVLDNVNGHLGYPRLVKLQPIFDSLCTMILNKDNIGKPKEFFIDTTRKSLQSSDITTSDVSKAYYLMRTSCMIQEEQSKIFTLRTHINNKDQIMKAQNDFVKQTMDKFSDKFTPTDLQKVLVK